MEAIGTLYARANCSRKRSRSRSPESDSISRIVVTTAAECSGHEGGGGVRGGGNRAVEIVGQANQSTRFGDIADVELFIAGDKVAAADARIGGDDHTRG